MNAIPFVDAHVHLWDLGKLRYPWLSPPFSDDSVNGSTEAIAQTYLPSDYRAETARWNVVGAVHVDAGAVPEDALAETDWLEGLASGEGLPDGIVAFAALNDPNVEALFEAHASRPHVRGIRHIINWHTNPFYSYTPKDLLADPAWQRGFAALAGHGLSFDVQAYPAQLGTVARLARRHPGVQLILNHCGMPLAHEDGGVAQWRRNMKALSELPQASVKISGFGIVDHGWTVGSITPFVLETIDMFGVDRCMFASDFPTDRLYASLDVVLESYHNIVAGFSDDEKRALFGTNANRIYRLGLRL